MPIDAQEIMRWLQQEEPAIYATARQEGEGFPREIERALPTLSATSREMAAQALATNNTAEATRVLLDMTGDSEPQVAVASARALSAMSKLPATPELIALTPSRHEPVVRSVLYRLIGQTGKLQDLDRLRAVLAAERDEEAGEDGQAAAVRLGGAPEKSAFVARVRAATPDTALRVCDQLRYVEQKDLLKALLPWLANSEEVMRLGSDRAPRMARMCDVAVWTAHQMGVLLQAPPAALDVYPLTVIDEARAALLTMPD
jgi:hypothetical protein